MSFACLYFDVLVDASCGRFSWWFWACQSVSTQSTPADDRSFLGLHGCVSRSGPVQVFPRLAACCAMYLRSARMSVCVPEE